MTQAIHNLRIERVYGSTPREGEKRVLVDRLWPRGISKAKARIDLWEKQIAPSTDLRHWFGHDPAKWEQFCGKYRVELENNTASADFVATMSQWCARGPVVLLFGAKDEAHNNAVVLEQWLAEKLAGDSENSEESRESRESKESTGSGDLSAAQPTTLNANQPEMTRWAGTHARRVQSAAGGNKQNEPANLENDAQTTANNSEYQQVIRDRYLTGERPLYGVRDTLIDGVTFGEGESPLKEARHIDVRNSVFKWKYPFWYADGVSVSNTVVEKIAHAGMWYVTNFSMRDCSLQGTKLFRRSSHISLTNVHFAHAVETLWSCEDVTLDHVQTSGIYVGKDSRHIRADHLDHIGDYLFDGAEDIVVDHSTIVATDAFWNTRNVTVKNSFINGQHLGWNSENLTFENCVIESDQGLCYIKGLTIRNTRMLHSDLTFELCSDIDAQITSHVDSIKNPISGRIDASSIGEVIADPSIIDPLCTQICENGQLISADKVRDGHDESDEHQAGYGE